MKTNPHELVTVADTHSAFTTSFNEQWGQLATTETITTQEIRAICLSLDITRFVAFEETLTHQYLYFCGFIRVVKVRKTDKVTTEIATLSFKNGILTVLWKKTTRHFPLYLYYCKGKDYTQLFSQFLDIAVIKIVKLCQTLGIKLLQGKSVTLQLGNTASSNSAAAEKTIADLFFWKLNKHATDAAKAMTKHLWRFVDKPLVSVFLRCEPQGEKASRHIFNLSLTDILRLKGTRLSTALWLSNANLIPIVRLVDKRHYHRHDLFHYKVLIPLLHQQHISMTKSDIRAFSSQPKNTLKMITSILSETKDMQQMIELARSIINLNRFKLYPSKIQIQLICIGSDALRFNRLDVNKTLLLLSMWTRHHDSMVRKVKIRKGSTLWERTISSLEHVIDYVSAGNNLQKNTNWTRLDSLADTWTRRLYDCEIEDYEIDNELTWDAIDKDFTNISAPKHTLSIRQLCDAASLHSEGSALAHCIYSYRQYCSKSGYRVFSLALTDHDTKKEVERATLGIHRISTQPDTYQYDQLKAYNNAEASDTLHRIAQQLIMHINDATVPGVQ